MIFVKSGLYTVILDKADEISVGQTKDSEDLDSYELKIGYTDYYIPIYISSYEEVMEKYLYLLDELSKGSTFIILDDEEVE